MLKLLSILKVAYYIIITAMITGYLTRGGWGSGGQPQRGSLFYYRLPASPHPPRYVTRAAFAAPRACAEAV